jgi:hypothetical protein
VQLLHETGAGRGALAGSLAHPVANQASPEVITREEEGEEGERKSGGERARPPLADVAAGIRPGTAQQLT